MRIRSALTRRVMALSAAVAVGAGVAGVGGLAVHPAAVPVVSAPLTGPGSGQCTSLATLPCPPLPVGQWYVLTLGGSTTVPVSQCDDGSGTWAPIHVTLSAFSVQGENVSASDDWCAPVVDPTAPDTGLPWSALFNAVAAQAN